MDIRVTDIKQFVYCPRVIYYNYVEPVPRKITYKMEYARKQHHELNQRENRRQLVRYNLIDGKRHFGFPVRSEKMNFQGKIDILIETEGQQEQRFFPVECKDTDRKIFKNVIYQLVSYAIAIEETTGTPVKKGFIYIIPEEKAYPIEITKVKKDYVLKMITMIKKIVQDEHYPEPHSRKRCRECEFKRYCNDLDIPTGQDMKEKNMQTVRQLFGYDLK